MRAENDEPMDRDRLLMMTQREGDDPVEELHGNVLGVDSLFGVRVLRDADPLVHAVRLADEMDGEIVRDLEHAQRAFAARSDAGRVEPVVLSDAEHSELAALAADATSGAAQADPETANEELRQGADEPATSRRPPTVSAPGDHEVAEHPHLFDEPALEHNRRAAALSIGVAVFFMGGAVVLVEAGVPIGVSLLVFVAGLLLAVLLVRRIRVHVREEGSASREASALLAGATEDDDVAGLTADSERPEGLGACGGATSEDARRRLDAARAWGDACATIDQPIVLVEPAAWLPDETLEGLVNSLPAGAEVTIVEPR
jgi:hypothetical protein